MSRRKQKPSIYKGKKCDGETLIECFGDPEYGPRYTIHEKSGCWLTDKPREKVTYTVGEYKKYGIVDNPQMYRLFWVIRNKLPFPEDKYQAGHLCETYSPNPLHCVNPEHIEPQDASTNMTTSYAAKERKPPTKPEKILPQELWGEKGTEYEKAKWYIINLTTEDESGCLATKADSSKAYPYKNIIINGVKKKVILSRFIYAAYNDIPYSELSDSPILHKCPTTPPNKCCINPKHLYQDSNSQNTLDTRHYHSGVKLSGEIVHKMCETFVKIQKPLIDGVEVKKIDIIKDILYWLKEEYEIEIGQEAIEKIFRGITWKDISKNYDIDWFALPSHT